MNTWLDHIFWYFRSLRDGIMYMMEWSESNSYITPFTMEQFPKFFMNATNVDITPVLDKWLQSNHCFGFSNGDNKLLLSSILAIVVCLLNVLFFHITELD